VPKSARRGDKGRGAIEAVSEKVSEVLGDDEDEEVEQTGRGRGSKKTASKKTAGTAKRSSRTRKSTKT